MLCGYVNYCNCAHVQALNLKQTISQHSVRARNKAFSTLCLSKKQGNFNTVCSCTKLRFSRLAFLIAFVDWWKLYSITDFEHETCHIPHCVWARNKAFSTLCSCTKLIFLRHVLLITYVDWWKLYSCTGFEQETCHFPPLCLRKKEGIFYTV